MGLVVTRRPGEAIEIGDPFGDIITVRVVGGMEGQVRLKIDAPLDVAVHREEIGAKIRRGERGEELCVAARLDLVAFANRLQRQSLQALGPGVRTELLLGLVEGELQDLAGAPTDTAGWAQLALLALDGLVRLTGSGQRAVEVLSEQSAPPRTRSHFGVASAN
ncbi:MAG: carbon storage regulator [Burkholderia sp.]